MDTQPAPALASTAPRHHGSGLEESEKGTRNMYSADAKVMSQEPTRSTEDVFMERMMAIINDGALALMTSIGHRTGLFDAMSDMPPATSAEIARRAALSERYVREWLGAMLAGGIVACDPSTGKFHLPSAHAACLTRTATKANLATSAQFIGLLGSVEDRIVECFHRGGGVPYSEYPRFQEAMADESAQTVVAALDDAILPLVPGLQMRLRQGIHVLDVGCGAGRAVNHMARIYPASRFAGYDFSVAGIAAAREEADRCRLSNVRFEVRDAATIEDRQAYDLVTAFDAIHDQARPAKVLERIHAALKDDGVFLMQDIKASSHAHENVDHLVGPFLYTVSCMHCMTVSLAEDGTGLGAMWGRQKALEMLGEAGFQQVEVKELSHDFMNFYYIARKTV
jgi:SAM-dependent methyltransferase